MSTGGGNNLLQETPGFTRDLYLPRFLTGVLPRVSREMRKWEQSLTFHADWPLLQQALSSLSRKRFHAQGGSFYALYSDDPHRTKRCV